MDLPTEPAGPVLILAMVAQRSALTLRPLLRRHAVFREAHTSLPTSVTNLIQGLTEVACVSAAINTWPDEHRH